jgi:gamma-glutamyl phosphate reductase
MIIIFCKTCGIPIKCYKSDKRLFCSKTCSAKYNNKKTKFKSGIALYRKAKKNKCELCDAVQFLLVHHKDKNRYNNRLNNLQTICASCHLKIHKVIKNFKNAYKKMKRDNKGKFVGLIKR